MEVVGLIIIVLLILVGIFLLVFLGKPSTESKATGYNQKLVESFVSSLPEIKISCGDQQIAYKEFVRACALGNTAFPCVTAPATACTVLTDETGKILDNSLKKWGYDYKFYVSNPTDKAHPYVEIINPPNTQAGNPPKTIINVCKKKPRKVGAEQPIPIATGGAEPAMIQLQVCY